MLENLKNKLKDAFTLSDKRLAGIAKYAKWAQRYSKSSIIFWGVSAAALLGAHAFGFQLPTLLTSIGIGGSLLMAAKSIGFAYLFKKIHVKAQAASNNRLAAKGLPIPAPELPAPVPRLAKLAAIKKSFNSAKTAVASRVAKLKPPKPAMP